MYASLDTVVQAVLTDKDADIEAPLQKANTVAQGLIDAVKLGVSQYPISPGRVAVSRPLPREPVDGRDERAGRRASPGRPARRRAPTRRRTPVTWVPRGGLSALIFALPMLLIFAVFSWYPIVRAVVMSLPGDQPRRPANWVGLNNFSRRPHGSTVAIAVRNTARFALLALVFGYPVPLVAAVLMSEVRRRQGVYWVLAYLPVVVPPVVAVLLWKFFYDAAPARRVQHDARLGRAGAVPLAAVRAMAMPSLVLEATWAAAGGTVIIYLAALISVPPELYDAAEVDGASVWRKVWHVTLPQLRGVLLITFILQIIGTVQVFLEPFLFTNGGPNNATLTVLLLVYNYAFGTAWAATTARRRR